MDAKTGMFRVWLGGSLAEFPGIPSRDPRQANPQRRKDTKRGCIYEYTGAARRRTHVTLSTVLHTATTYTMALTLPGDLSGLPHAYVKRQFLRLCDRITCARPEFMQRVGAMWKQELQLRGALHFHLLLYGLDESTRRDVQRWIAERWNALICAHCSADERAKHLWWHLRDGHDGKRRGSRNADYSADCDNMQLVRNFAGYFAKYLGKDESCPPADNPIPGKWWGIIGKKNIPWADKREIKLPVRVAIHMQRIARKLRQKRANAAKHAAVCRKAGLVRDGQPTASEFSLACGRHRKAREMGQLYREQAASHGVRFGKYRFPPCLRYSPVKLIGSHVPDLARRISEFAVERFRDELENCPF